MSYVELLDAEETEEQKTSSAWTWISLAVVLALCLAFWAAVIAAIVLLL